MIVTGQFPPKVDDEQKYLDDFGIVKKYIPVVANDIQMTGGLPPYQMHMLADILRENPEINNEFLDSVSLSINHSDIVATDYDQLELAEHEDEYFPEDNAELCSKLIGRFYHNIPACTFLHDKVKNFAMRGLVEYQACLLQLQEMSGPNFFKYDFVSFEDQVLEKVRAKDAAAISAYAEFAPGDRGMPIEKRTEMFRESFELEPRALTAHRLIEYSHNVLYHQYDYKIPADKDHDFYQDAIEIAEKAFNGTPDSYMGKLAYDIGDIYLNGRYDFARDWQKAARYYNIALQCGYTQAERELQIIREGQK